MSDKKEVKTIRPKVNLPHLMGMAARDMQNFSISLGFQDTIASLQKIAQRAIDIDDQLILDELEHLCILIREENKTEEKKETIEK